MAQYRWPTIFDYRGQIECWKPNGCGWQGRIEDSWRHLLVPGRPWWWELESTTSGPRWFLYAVLDWRCPGCGSSGPYIAYMEQPEGTNPFEEEPDGWSPHSGLIVSTLDAIGGRRVR